MPQSHLPPEIFDQIIGLLRDKPEALKKFCIISKSLVICTRKHLFNQIEITDLKLFRRWIETFPDPAYSSANHTRSLFAKCVDTFTAGDTTVGGWIRSFVVCSLPHLEALDVMHGSDDIDKCIHGHPPRTFDLAPVDRDPCIPTISAETHRLQIASLAG